MRSAVEPRATPPVHRGDNQVADVHASFRQDETGTRLYRLIDGRIGYETWVGDDPKPSWVTYFFRRFQASGNELQILGHR